MSEEENLSCLPPWPGPAGPGLPPRPAGAHGPSSSPHRVAPRRGSARRGCGPPTATTGISGAPAGSSCSSTWFRRGGRPACRRAPGPPGPGRPGPVRHAVHPDLVAVGAVHLLRRPARVRRLRRTGRVPVAMLLCVGLAASGPRALSGDTRRFVIAFCLLRGLQLPLYARARHHLPATRALYSSYLSFSAPPGSCGWPRSRPAARPVRVLGRGAAHRRGRGTGHAPAARPVPLNPSHLADRFQLFVLIVLGESVARLISAAALRPWSLPLAVVLAAALLTLAALWWAWLTAADRHALDRPRSHRPLHRANLPIVAGIAAASAGPAHRHPGRPRRRRDRRRAQVGPLRRRQRLPAGQRRPSFPQADPAGPGTAGWHSRWPRWAWSSWAPSWRPSTWSPP